MFSMSVIVFVSAKTLMSKYPLLFVDSNDKCLNFIKICKQI